MMQLRRHPSAFKSAIAAIVAIVALIAGSTTPAFAGTLTSASFTASTPYTYTKTQNTRYDWGFTAATTATLSKATMSVPAGTGASNRYLALRGTGGNYASTPDSAANSITADYDIRVKVTLDSWNVGAQQVLVSKWTDAGGQGSMALSVEGGELVLYGSTDGVSPGQVSSGALGIADGSTKWVRSTTDADNGSGHAVFTFYTSDDGSSWNQIGSPIVTGSPMSWFDSNAPVTIGGYNNGTTGIPAGKIHYAETRNSINGTIVNKFDANDATAAQAASGSWTSSSPQAETWTVNRSGTNLPADIASDLSVSGVTGLPSGGIANYRFIDGVASYYFTGTSIPASTPCTISLTGFTNTATAGNYSSLIKTWDNAGTPAVVDSVTTATLAFTDYSSSQNVYATVDPSFSFTVGNQSSACNGESNFAASAGTATTVALGHLAMSSNVSGGQALTIASNANNGFTVYIRGAQASQNLRSSGHNWTDVAGTYASPAALGAGERFGYTFQDATASTSVSNPASAGFAALTNATTNKVMGSATTQSGSGCVSFDAQTGAATPAGSYTATVIYTAVPSF